MQTLLIVFGIIIVFLLVLILASLGSIQKTLTTYLMFTLGGVKNLPNRGLYEAKTGKKEKE